MDKNMDTQQHIYTKRENDKNGKNGLYGGISTIKKKKKLERKKEREPV